MEEVSKYYVSKDPDGVLYYFDMDGNNPSYVKPLEGEFINYDTDEPYDFEDEVDNFMYVASDDVGRIYYFNPEKTWVTYHRPVCVRLVDYETDEPYLPLGECIEPSFLTRFPSDDDLLFESEGENELKICEGCGIEIPPSISGFLVPMQQTPSPKAEVHELLFENFKEEITKFQMHEYAVQFFRQKRSSRRFMRKNVSLEALVAFTDAPIGEPLLRSIPKKFEKPAINCFKNILAYTGVIPSKQPNTAAEDLVKDLYNMPELRDEVYFQLVKQTTQYPSYEMLSRTLNLFLIIATIFPSTRNSEKWILAHLARLSKCTDRTCRDIARFTYIRFSARSANGYPMESNSLGWINNIPNEINGCTRKFNVSLGELIWSQRLAEPRLTIPRILHSLVETLLTKGPEEHQGIFRLQGNIRNVARLAQRLDEGEYLPVDTPIDDVASLLKKFLRELADPLVPYRRLDDLFKIYESGNKEYLPFVRTLPSVHFYSLAYVIGLLQYLVRFSSVNLMNSSNLAIVFGPNIVQTDIKEPGLCQKYTSLAFEFTEHLINNLDTSDYYPISKDLLSSAIEK